MRCGFYNGHKCASSEDFFILIDGADVHGLTALRALDDHIRLELCLAFITFVIHDLTLPEHRLLLDIYFLVILNIFIYIHIDT